MKHQIVRCLGVVLTLLSTTSYAQSVGIGTETPNSNAILELVAPDANQGLLVPRLSTSERTSTTFTNSLSASDNGLLIYDSDEETFYFWISSQWVALASGNISALPDQSGQNNRFLTTDGTTAQWAGIDFNTLSNIPTDLADGDNDTQLSDGEIASFGYIKSPDDADASTSNELQDLTLTGNTLSLTNSTIGIDLSPFSGTNTDNQTLGLSGNNLSITGGNTIDISAINTNLTEVQVDAFANNNGYLTSEIDGSTTNEIQDISTDGTAGDITLSSGSSLTLNVNDADASTTNEIQDISTNGVAGNITLSSGSTLSLNVDDADASTTNEIELPTQTPADNGRFLRADGAGGVTYVAEVDGSITNEIQDISTDGTAGDITLSSGSSLTLNVNDADASASNEIQDISTNGNAGNISLSSGSTLNLNVDDADADNTNEFQDLSISGNTLSLSNSAATVDLSPFSGTNTDNQTLGLSGSNLSITGGNTIDISAINTNLTEVQVDAFANNNGYLTSEVDGSITNEIQTISRTGTTVTLSNSGGSFSIADNDNSASNEIQNISTNGNAGNISLSGGATLNLNVDDGDADDSNEFQTISRSGTTVTLSNSGGSFSIADNDNSTSNEIQNISTNGNAGNISLSGGATLNLNVDDGDADDSNEFQTISRTGTNVTLSNSGGSFSIADNDNSASNEIQNISTNGNAGNISLSGGATLNLNVDDGDADDLNEIQTVSKSGNTVTLSNSGGSFSVADNDNSSSNEYNTGMSLSGTSIRVTDGGGTRSVNIGGTFATDAELDSRTFNPSAFKATIKSGTIPVGVTNLVFDTEAFDLDGSFESGVYTVPEDGLYNFGGLMIFQNVPTGFVQIVIRDASSSVLYSKAFAPNSIQSSIGFSVDLQLTAGDKITVALSNTTLGGNEAQPIQIIASPSVANFFFCGKRFN